MSSEMISGSVILVPITSIAGVSGGQSMKVLEGVWFKGVLEIGKLVEDRR